MSENVSLKELSKSSDKFITNIIESLEQIESRKWEHFLNSKDFKNLLPFNPMTGTRYKKLNCLILMMAQSIHDWDSNKFLTYNQIKELGGNNKGAKGTPVQHFFGIAYLKDTEGNVLDKIKYQEYLKLPREVKANYDLTFRERTSYVFNLDDVKGLPENIVDKKVEFKSDENMISKFLENIIENKKIDFKTKNTTKAFFDPINDRIRLPHKKYFKSENIFYQAISHELIHWTGHESRLKRIDKENFVDHTKYAYEELIAELGSLQIMDYFNVTETLVNSLAYLKGWLNQCEEQSKEKIHSAYIESKKAYNFLLY